MRKAVFTISIILMFWGSEKIFSQIMFTASLDGSQEVPGVTTTGKGTAWAVLSPDMTSLSYHVTYAKLQSAYTAAHFHLGAAGAAGGVVRAITFSGNTASGEWTNLPDTILAKLLKEEIYINVHTSGNPSGEIRGQLTPVRGIGFTASLDGSQENPAVATNAKGTGWAVLENNGTQVKYDITVAGLSSSLTASHFHNAAAGTNGGVIQAVAFTDSSASGNWTGFTDNIITEFLNNRMYFNVHTSNYSSGEIRGQLIRQSEVIFKANLEGNQEVPAVASTGRGTAWGVLNFNQSSLTYDVTYARLQSAFTAAHFHLGAAGVAGGVVRAITFNGNNASGDWSGLPDSLIQHLIKGNIYINIHTSGNPSGEIRGQLLLNQGVGFTAKLSGAQEVPGVTTNARGTGWLSLGTNSSEANSPAYQVTIAGLSTGYTAAHFHSGIAGVSGGVIQAITFSDSTVSSSWSNISDNNLAALAKGSVYINVHTSSNPSGEIRGQVLFSNVYSGIIPVELTSFSAKVIGGSAELIWTTATETNNRGFEIQKSRENSNFSKIGFIEGMGSTVDESTYKFVDIQLLPGSTYYRLKQIDFDGTFSYSKTVNVNITAPKTFGLHQNYPNPFNPYTTISFQLSAKSNVVLKIFNILGKEVAALINEVREAGFHSVVFDASSIGGLSSGVYFYKLSLDGGRVTTKKMTLMK